MAAATGLTELQTRRRYGFQRVIAVLLAREGSRAVGDD